MQNNQPAFNPTRYARLTDAYADTWHAFRRTRNGAEYARLDARLERLGALLARESGRLLAAHARNSSRGE